MCTYLAALARADPDLAANPAREVKVAVVVATLDRHGDVRVERGTVLETLVRLQEIPARQCVVDDSGKTAKRGNRREGRGEGEGIRASVCVFCVVAAAPAAFQLSVDGRDGRLGRARRDEGRPS